MKKAVEALCFPSLTFLRKERKNNMRDFISNYTDPQNPIWLKIARWIVTSMTVIVFLGCLVLGILDSNYYLGMIDEYFAIIIWIPIGVIVAAIHHVIGMLSLSLLYNVQQIKDNTKKM